MPVEIYRAAADEDDEVWSLDIDQLVCPYLPICDPVVDGVDRPGATRPTSARCSRARSRPAFGAFLDDNGILE